MLNSYLSVWHKKLFHCSHSYSHHQLLNPLSRQNFSLLDKITATQITNETIAANAGTLGKTIARKEMNSHAKGTLLKSARLMADKFLTTAHGTVNCPFKIMKIWHLNWCIRTETEATVTVVLRFVISKRNLHYWKYFIANISVKILALRFMA